MGEFRDILKALRKERGLTQDQLAQELGISRSSVSMYERGEREPDFETLEVIADYFNVDMNYLTGWNEDPTNYDDPELIASIPLNYLEAAHGDTRTAFNMMNSVDQDARNTPKPDYAKTPHEHEMLLLARHMDSIPNEAREALKKQFRDAVDLYLSLQNKSTPED